MSQRADPVPYTDIQSTVTRLLQYTKQLLESLTAWATGKATEEAVSDVYVQLGNEFNLARRKFLNANVDVDDLGDVPYMLRVILERALAEPASEANLERYLPQIREIIVNLLKQLKHKQTFLVQGQIRQQQQQQHQFQQQQQPQLSPQSQQQQQQQQPVQQQQRAATSRRSSQSQQSAPQRSQQFAPQAQNNEPNTPVATRGAPTAAAAPYTNPRFGPSGAASQQAQTQAQTQAQHGRHRASTPSTGSVHSSTSASTRAGNAQSPRSNVTSERSSSKSEVHVSKRTPPNASPLAQLQRSGALERAASKRYSSHHLSQMMNGVSAEHTLLPTSNPHKGPRPADYVESSTVKDEVPDSALPHPAPDVESSNRGDSIVSTSSQGSSLPQILESGPQIEIPSRSMSRRSSLAASVASSATASRASSQPSPQRKRGDGTKRDSVRPTSAFSPNPNEEDSNGESEPPEPKPLEMVVFLRMGDRIRKASLLDPPTLPAVRMQFVDMFAYMPTGDEIFPEMTVQDTSTGIDYELTNATVADIKEGSLLTLQVKGHDASSDIAAQLSSLQATVKELVAKVSSGPSSSTPTIPSVPRGVSPQPATPSSSDMPSWAQPGGVSGVGISGRSNSAVSSNMPSRRLAADQTEQIQKEMAVIRQVSAKTIATMRREIEALTAKLAEIRSSSTGAGRNYMTQTKAKLDGDCTSLLTLVDDLQDIIDAQRIMVAQRNIKLPPKQLDSVRRDLKLAESQLGELTSFVDTEEPTWKKTWEAELNTVIEEQNYVKLQKDILHDLQTDIAKARETFDLVETCSNELPSATAGSGRLLQIQPIEPGREQEVASAVLSEIIALKPNHDQRMEAARRTERMRERELALRSDEFEDELESFVGDQRLRKTGGIEEVERRRRERDEETRKLQKQFDAEGAVQKQKLREERRKQKAAAKASAENEDFADASETTEAPDDVNAPAS